SVGDRFNVGRATAVRSVRRVIKALLKLKDRFIQWPNDERARVTANELERTTGFPGVTGVLDGTHIKIASPKHNSESYINRKNFHSIQLQVVCDETRQFTYCYVGQPGSVHDQRVLRISTLQTKLNNKTGFSEDTHLIADAAYALQDHLMVPYKDNGHLTREQKNYNYCLSATRTIIERSIGLLKCRFRSLLDRLDMKRTDLIPYYMYNGLLYFTQFPVIASTPNNRESINNRMRNRTAERKRQQIIHNLAKSTNTLTSCSFQMTADDLLAVSSTSSSKCNSS
ncbi:hypothetical protein NQ315_000450, partial [Exocentrus adspersus]